MCVGQCVCEQDLCFIKVVSFYRSLFNVKVNSEHHQLILFGPIFSPVTTRLKGDDTGIIIKASNATHTGHVSHFQECGFFNGLFLSNLCQP